MTSTSNTKRLLYFPPTLILFFWGYLQFLITGKSSALSYKSLRFLHVITNCKFNNFMNAIIGYFRPYNQQNKAQIQSVLGNFENAKIDEIVNSIQKDGYYIFEEKLNEKTINEILQFAKSTPVSKMEKLGKYSTEKYIIGNNPEIQSPRYQFHNSDLFACNALNNVIFDELFLTISAKYLKCIPIFDYFLMWWSFPFQGKLANDAAQLYHYDMDRIKFLKFFFYITDVNTDNGPHCFVKHSHIDKPNKVRKDGRISDEEINKYCKAENILEINGVKGTVIAVDTIGFHKGKSLNNGSRLLFQLLYSNSLFGQMYYKEKLPKELYTQYQDFIDTNIKSFDQTFEIPKK